MALKKMSFKAEFTRTQDDFGQTVEWNKKGQALEGVFKEKKVGEGKYESNIYMVENNNGLFALWGSHQIDEVLNDLDAPFIVKVVYRGKKKVKKSGQLVKDFDIMIAEIPDGFDVEHDIWDISEETPKSE